MYLLAIDIGNTTTSLGVFSAEGGSLPVRQVGAYGGKGKRLILNFKLATHNKNVSFYKRNILSIFNKAGIKLSDINKIIICSVVPKKTPVFKRLLSSTFRKNILIVSKDINIPIKNKYKKPRQVGQDRLVNAYAGLRLFGPGLILIDFGTAITFDIVSKKGEYLGGLIFPGIDLSFEALSNKTALLPRVKIKLAKSLIGSNTQDCINNGVVYGVAGACDVIVDRLQKKFKGYKVIATGGNANLIKKYSKKISNVYPYLTLEGLRLISSLSINS
ncbi:MAG: type III pantothenate kinase [Candidatus Omnitrophota bacterium]